MKLFTVGPTEMYESTLEVKKRKIPYFRTEEFSKINIENAEMLKKCLDAEKTAEIVMLTASGTGAMEAVVMNCLNKKDKVLVIVGGTFGKRFSQICKIHDIPYDEVVLEENEELTRDKLYKYTGKGYSTMLVNLHETQTGQLYDIELLSAFCKENKMFLIVDAISTFLCDSYSMKENSIDVTIISSQKGLCLSPGISMVALSERMQEKMKENIVHSLYFNFQEYNENMKRGQTPFTPAIGIHYELHDMLEKVLECGIDTYIEKVAQRANHFRKQVKELPVKIPQMQLSNAMTPILFQDDIAEHLVEFLRYEKEQMVNPTGGKLGKRSIRVSHIGNLDLCDYDELVENMKEWFALNQKK